VSVNVRVCVFSIFRHISNRLHLGKRYKFSQANTIRVISLSLSVLFFNYFTPLDLLSLFITYSSSLLILASSSFLLLLFQNLLVFVGIVMKPIRMSLKQLIKEKGNKKHIQKYSA